MWPWLGKVFLDRISKIWPIKEKNYKLDIIKIKKFHTANFILLIDEEFKPLIGRKYLQITFLTKDSYPEYTKNPQNSTIRKQTPTEKMDRRLEQSLLQRRYRDGK